MQSLLSEGGRTRLHGEPEHPDAGVVAPVRRSGESFTLCAIAASHRKSPAQVVLRWLTQRGIVPIVKSANPQRMKENLNIFDFTLAEEEMQQIAALDTGHTCVVPRQSGLAVDEFLKKSLLYQL